MNGPYRSPESLTGPLPIEPVEITPESLVRARIYHQVEKGFFLANALLETGSITSSGYASMVSELRRTLESLDMRRAP